MCFIMVNVHAKYNCKGACVLDMTLTLSLPDSVRCWSPALAVLNCLTAVYSNLNCTIRNYLHRPENLGPSLVYPKYYTSEF